MEGVRALHWWLLITRRWFFFAIAGLLLGSAISEQSQAFVCRGGAECGVLLAYDPQAFMEETWIGHPSELSLPPPGPGEEWREPGSAVTEWDMAVRVIISIPQQKAYVFKGDELLDTSPVSTGKPGYRTPTGTFPILQKKVHHHSNLYSNAPMPYMQRLTYGGVALHAGDLPGYPASHGCIRLPWNFAKKLYSITRHGTPVIVTNAEPQSPEDALRLA